MNLGRCYARLGRTASAWTTYRQAAGLARAAGQEDREQVARREITALEIELAKVKVRLSAEARAHSPKVTLDGIEFGTELWDVATPVDPGEHELIVSAPGSETWSRRFQIAARELHTIDVALRALQGSPAPPAKVETKVDAPQSGNWRFQHTAAVIAAGLGVAGLGLGAYWTVTAYADYDEGRQYCEDEILCHEDGVKLREGAILKGDLATVSFAVGGAGLASGMLLWLTAPSLAAESPRTAGQVGDEIWSVGVSGVW
jgi:serine/threonine-protein kinase